MHSQPFGSRTALKRLNLQGILCRKDKGVIDEIPAAYKDIDTVMANQDDLVEALHTLLSRLCALKGN